MIRKRIQRALFRLSPRLGESASTFWDQLSPVWQGKLGARQATRYVWRGICPGASGRFRYYGTTVYFPRGSFSFRRACEEGTYEREVTEWLCRLARPNEVFIEIGANIGLSAIPVLRTVVDVRVVSFEPSPSSIAHLGRTWRESDFKDRWEIVPKALAESEGVTKFFTSSAAYAVFDGLLDTSRGGANRVSRVEQTTMDQEWRRLGKPRVAVIKIDVEGAEARVLEGARDVIERDTPPIVLEWTTQNLVHYGVPAEQLLEYAITHRYELLSLPTLNCIRDVHILAIEMLRTESYLLVPRNIVDRVV
jgi:FkbM family methyltransferase